MHAAVLVRSGWERVFAVVIFCSVTMTAASAQSFLTIHRFAETDTITNPNYLTEGFDGKLYGTGSGQPGTSGYDYGAFFKAGVFGTFTPLQYFCEQGNACPGGGEPVPLLLPLLGQNGDFYLTMGTGGPNGYGTVSRITPEGTLRAVHSVCEDAEGCAGGFYTLGVVLAPDGSLYGVNRDGADHGYGAVFKISSQGAYSVIYRFCALNGCTDGAHPSSLVVGTDGNLYGTTLEGGANHYWGTVFKLTPSGMLTTLHSFCSKTNCADSQSIDGQAPFGLIQASDGNFYGITGSGGEGEAFSTVFKMAPDGTTTTLYADECTGDFCPPFPTVPLIQGSDGNFYGVSSARIFKVTLDGTVSTIYTLTPQDGYEAFSLMQATNGKFYGTTYNDLLYPRDKYGTIFRLDLGLAPFIKTVLTQGPVGADVTIIGDDLAV